MQKKKTKKKQIVVLFEKALSVPIDLSPQGSCMSSCMREASSSGSCSRSSSRSRGRGRGLLAGREDEDGCGGSLLLPEGLLVARCDASLRTHPIQVSSKP